MATKFIKFPFADTGTKTTVPDDAQVSQEVSYETGYTPPYSEINGLNIERAKFNQLMFDISGNIQQWQVANFPNWITAAENGGVAFPYRAGAIVLYNNTLYQSLTNSNVTEPSTDPTQWAILDYIQSTAEWIKGVTFDASVSQGDIVAININTGIYQGAIANTNYLANAVGIADVTNQRILTSGVWVGTVGSQNPLTAGDTYYLSDATAGEITNTQPSDSSVSNSIIGNALSTSNFFLKVQKIQTQQTLASAKAFTLTSQDLIVPAGTNPSATIKLLFDQVAFGTSYYVPATGEMIADRDGIYSVKASVAFWDDNTIMPSQYQQVDFFLVVYVNDNIVEYGTSNEFVRGSVSVGYYIQPAFSTLLKLQANDRVSIYALMQPTAVNAPSYTKKVGQFSNAVANPNPTNYFCFNYVSEAPNDP